MMYLRPFIVTSNDGSLRRKNESNGSGDQDVELNELSLRG